MAKIQSIEPNIADLANGWLKSYKLDYKLEQESLNAEEINPRFPAILKTFFRRRIE